MLRPWFWIKGQGLIWLAGFVLIAAGIICLYLSDKVVTGWWQGTLDAFGVGFIVGGLVDVVAISALNQIITNQEKRQQSERQYRQELRTQAASFLDASRLALRSFEQLHRAYTAGTPDIPSVKEAVSQTVSLVTDLDHAHRKILLIGSASTRERATIVCEKAHECTVFFLTSEPFRGAVSNADFHVGGWAQLGGPGLAWVPGGDGR